MLGARRDGLDCRKGGDFDDGGYVETDPTGRYGRYGDILGKGAMKTVYRAFDELQGIEVAWNQARICDVLRSPEALERLYSEVHLLATLKHDSIISFHSSWVDTDNRTFNFITEMFTSGTLREYRQRYRRVDIRAVKNWARQILHGLVYLHSHDPPVIHRDLKCDNIFVNGHLGQVKIGDLGLAAVLKGSQQAHSVIGTPEFMAPELYDEEYNELVDIYSFGMCVMEMLTGDYPYSECSNPAQIYKKVTSGRLPNAFHEIKDPEAQRFIGRCLENVCKRPSAWQLLLDPFLQLEITENPSHMETGLSHACLECHVSSPPSSIGHNTLTTDMKITGKINPNDDTIDLGVQIADKNGSVTIVRFPFDINSDTPIDVANEMVKELEIIDGDSSLIAEVIDREIASLVPHWKNEVPADVYIYHEEEDDGFHNYSSSPTSSQGSSFSRMHPTVTECRPNCDWFQDIFDDDGETVSYASTYSGKYISVNCSSGYEQDSEISPRRRETPSHSKKSSRFCHEGIARSETYCSAKSLKEGGFFLEPPLLSGHTDMRASLKGKLLRNRSFVDMRSQLLHRSLAQGLNSRLSKTVGSVEGVHHPDSIEVAFWEKALLGGDRKLGYLGTLNMK